jgi:hypothetical protein
MQEQRPTPPDPGGPSRGAVVTETAVRPSTRSVQSRIGGVAFPRLSAKRSLRMTAGRRITPCKNSGRCRHSTPCVARLNERSRPGGSGFVGPAMDAVAYPAAWASSAGTSVVVPVVCWCSRRTYVSAMAGQLKWPAVYAAARRDASARSPRSAR